MQMSGARVLVAGATGGLGGAIARALVQAGAQVAVSGRDPARLAAIAAETGGVPLEADLVDPTAPELLVADAAARLGGLDAVVCAVGVVAFGPITELDDAVLTHLFQVNTLLPIRLTRAALGVLRQGGMVVNVSSVVAEQPTAGMAAFSATKAGLTGFDTAARREARRAGIHVLDVRPPHLATGLDRRPIAGVAPRLPEGRDPAVAARAVVAAMVGNTETVDFAIT